MHIFEGSASQTITPAANSISLLGNLVLADLNPKPILLTNRLEPVRTYVVLSQFYDHFNLAPTCHNLYPGYNLWPNLRRYY